MSCSRTGTGHAVSYFARGRMSTEDARGIYHDLIREHVAAARSTGHDPYERLDPEQAQAALRRLRHLIADTPREARTGTDLAADRADDAITRRLQAIREARPVPGCATTYLTAAEAYAIERIPAAIETATDRCTQCGRFTAPGTAHQCPRGTTKEQQPPSPAATTTSVNRDTALPQRTFGVEVEMTDINEPQAEQALVSRTSHHDGWEVTTDGSVTGWACSYCIDGEVECTDCADDTCPECDGTGSQDGEDCTGCWGVGRREQDCWTCDGTRMAKCVECDGHPHSSGIEVISPVLLGEQSFDEMRDALGRLPAKGAAVDETCGLHVHVGAGDLTPEDLRRLLVQWQANEADIYRLVAPDRESSHYAARLDSDAYTSIDEAITAHDQLAARVADADDPVRADRLAYTPYKYIDRYAGLNFAAIAKHRTVEYRLHHGTIDLTQIEEWSAFCVAYTEAASRPHAHAQLAQARGITEVINTLTMRGLLHPKYADSLLTRVGYLPPGPTEEPDQPHPVDRAA